mgnify:CR=1 FL=1
MDFRKTLCTSIVLSFAVGFFFLIYSPLELFVYNINDFWYDIYYMLPRIFISFMVCFAANVLILLFAYVANNKLFYLFICCELFLYICMYIQSVFLSQDLPPITGETINWNEGWAINILCSTVMLIVVFTSVIVLYKKFKNYFNKIVVAISIFITLLLLITLVFLIASDYKNVTAKHAKAYITDKDEMLMSTNQNFIILLLDAVDATGFKEVMDEDPESKKSFDDFTFFPDTVCAYPYTYYSIPFIIGGVWFENQETYADYCVNALTNSEFLSTMEDNEYDLYLYDDGIYYNNDSARRFKNAVEARPTISFIDFLKPLMRLVAYRCFPYGLKQYTHPENFISKQYTMDIGEHNFFNWDNKQFYDLINEGDFETTDKKVFKFIHLCGCHAPYIYDENMNLIDETSGSYEKMEMSCLKMCRSFLDKLRQQSFFDNSVIIIMADHGYEVDGSKDHFGRQNPILFIHGLHEVHELNISEQPIGYADLQTIYSQLIAQKTSKQLVNIGLNKRRYLYYNNGIDRDGQRLIEYIQRGYAADESSMFPTGKVYEAQ